VIAINSLNQQTVSSSERYFATPFMDTVGQTLILRGKISDSVTGSGLEALITANATSGISYAPYGDYVVKLFGGTGSYNVTIEATGYQQLNSSLTVNSLLSYVNQVQNYTLVQGSSPASYNLLVTLTGTGSGTVTPDSGTITWTGSSGTASYATGTAVTLIPTANTDSSFAGWSGACTSGTGNCTVTMNAARSATATFNIQDNARINSTGYGTLGNATTSVTAGATIKAKTMTFIENLTINPGVSFYLKGGYDATFTSQTGYTTIDGTLTLKGTGTVTVDRVIVK